MKGDRIGEFEELVLLCVRQLDEDASSVEIQRMLRERAERSVALGAIYAALDRLERKKLVESWLGEPTAQRGGRRKRFYRVTTEGEGALEASRRIREALWSGAEVES